MEAMTPEQKAEAAAEAIAADGDQVTARTVQRRARVAMAIAAATARSWNQREAAARDVPEMPDGVLMRVEGLWRAAVEVAREEHATEREGWASRVQTAEEERSDLAEEIDRITSEHAAELESAQAEHDRLLASISDLEKKLTAVQESADDARAAAAAAESRAAASEGLLAGLREALATLAPDGVVDTDDSKK